MIVFDGVSYSYGTTDDGRKSLSDISFTIAPGECVVLCGESGCGKTTVTRLVNGLIPHHFEGTVEGTVSVCGVDIAEQPLAKTSHTVGSVFQNPRSQFFNVDTTNELAFGCENQALPVEEIQMRLNEAVGLFDLGHLLNRSIFELSGGEKQRIACASVYATHPEVVVLDEPSSNLDSFSIEQLKNTIALLKAAGKTVIVSEHRLYYLADLADRFFYMREGRLERIFSSDEIRRLPARELAALGLRELDLAALSFLPRKGEGRAGAPQPATGQDACEGSQGPSTPPFDLPPGQTLIGFDQVVCELGRKPVLAVHSLALKLGEIVAVIGHNGAGKSTFAHCLCGLRKHKGTISIHNRTAKPKRRINKSYMVMQDVNHQLFTESVMEEVVLNAPEQSLSEVDGILDKLGLEAFRDTHPLALSGGQKQRVAVASALCSGKDILVYDEPTSGLDYKSMCATCRLIETAAEKAELSLVVTHDVEFILNCCTSVLHIDQGSVSDYYKLDDEGVRKVKRYFVL